MSELIYIDDDYRQWVKSIKLRYLRSQMRAVVKANQELLYFYWTLGKDIAEMHVEELWGKKVLKNLSVDLRHDLPDVAGLSETALGYMKRFYLLYSQIDEIHPQAVGKNAQEDGCEIDPQHVGELFSIPWGHHRFIIDKCYSNPQKAWFFVRKAYQNNWGRDMLLNFMDTDGDPAGVLQPQCMETWQVAEVSYNCDNDMLLHVFEDIINEEPQIFYSHSDHLGSASWITDMTGTPVQYIHYMPYGEQLVYQTLTDYNERFKFIGKEGDDETGYMGWIDRRYVCGSPYTTCN